MGTPAAPDRSRLRILVVEDDDTIGRHLETGLRGNGYVPTWSRTGTSALAEATRTAYDAVLLDLGLPDLDGLDLARTLRARFPDLLIVILTARTDDIDVIAGLDAGADDYLVKPFSLTVLLARLRAHLRRQTTTPQPQQPLRIGDLVIDTTARRCTLHGTDIPLRPKEFDLLTLLVRNPGTAVSRESLMAQVWDENWFGPTKTLDVTMAGLRRRLTQAAEESARPCRLPHITTLRGHGYRLECGA
ncbi:two-component system response regulator [Streptomyces cellostaticus]|uniref:Two-component system response regulator n=1 Tax=Streptomyces cellostaticus TaxID=67285 RepID=A0A101NSD8_9ACTN|nr:response regulator transcription factor [Streptomyces cellostaticus]KUM98475.1 two-component system response regulator [Streptomyces cellostaticus]